MKPGCNAFVSGGGLDPPRPLRALAPQASASAIPPLGPARPLYPAGRPRDTDVQAARAGRTGHHCTRWAGAGRSGIAGGARAGRAGSMYRVSAPHHLSAAWADADALRTKGQLAAARDLLEPVADVAAIRLGPDDPDVIETMRRLATVHPELGELASARRVAGGAAGGAEAPPGAAG